MRLLALLAVVLVATSCGTRSSTVPPSAIAVVGGRPVARAALDSELARARRAYAARGQVFPSAGTPAYERLKDSAVRLLVERAQLEVVARRHGVSVGPVQVDRGLRRFKQTTFGGSAARYRERLRLTGMTDADVREAIRVQLLVAGLRRAAPEALRVQLPVVYAKGFAPTNAG